MNEIDKGHMDNNFRKNVFTLLIHLVQNDPRRTDYFPAIPYYTRLTGKIRFRIDIFLNKLLTGFSEPFYALPKPLDNLLITFNPHD